MPTAKNSPALHAEEVKNLAGLVPGVGCRGSSWRPRMSHSVMYAPVNTKGWTSVSALPKSAPLMPKMGRR